HPLRDAKSGEAGGAEIEDDGVYVGVRIKNKDVHMTRKWVSKEGIYNWETDDLNRSSFVAPRPFPQYSLIRPIQLGDRKAAAAASDKEQAVLLPRQGGIVEGPFSLPPGAQLPFKGIDPG